MVTNVSGKKVRHAVIATAGHVDHGKSTLVKALTGADPDRLPEEKLRGITIDLGFAHLRLEDESTVFDIGVVDVPGHEDFVKNMVAGVGSVSLALFVVAADDGWMAQSEEHLQILSYLGVERAVVALTKSDLLREPAEVAIRKIRDHLLNSPFADAPIIPVSVIKGQGTAELRQALLPLLAGVPDAEDIAKPRLPIDRAFALRGVGTVVTGTLTGGKFRYGQPVEIQPAGLRAHIRNIQNHHRTAESVQPGMRVALNLPEIDASPQLRGQVVTFAHAGGGCEVVEVSLTRSDRQLGNVFGPPPLKHGGRVRVHLGSAAVCARVILAEDTELLPGGSSLAQLRLDTPLVAFQGDRFILRDFSGRVTLAGGVVLDPQPRPKLFRTAAQQQFLSAIARAPRNLAVTVEALLQRDQLVARSGLLLRSPFSAGAIDQHLLALSGQREVKLTSELAIDSTKWQSLCDLAANIIEGHHQAHPEHEGLPLAELQTHLARVPHLAALFPSVIQELTQGKFERSGALIRRRGHQPELPPQLKSAGLSIRAALSLKPLDPPSRRELEPDAPRRQALRYFIQTGQVVELSPEIVLLSGVYERARNVIRHFLQSHAAATVSDLRQALGASRRVVVPLLEKLDREGLTRRMGDQRVLKSEGQPATA